MLSNMSTSNKDVCNQGVTLIATGGHQEGGLAESCTLYSVLYISVTIAHRLRAPFLVPGPLAPWLLRSVSV